MKIRYIGPSASVTLVQPESIDLEFVHGETVEVKDEKVARALIEQGTFEAVTTAKKSST